MIERVKSGIGGFDNLIQGGFVPNSINLISGGTGTGKTIFCLQYLFNGAKEYNEKGIYISFEEQEQDLKDDVSGLGLSFDKLDNKIKFMYMPAYGISNFIPLMKLEIETFKAKRVVIDSVTALAMPMEDEIERRKQIFRVRETLKSLNCTALLTSEVLSESAMGSEALSTFSRFGIEEFFCDGVIVLHYAGIGGESDRAIRVVKMRRTDHIRGPVPMKIGNLGIKVLKPKYNY